ncbi:septal ring lytic transglycosylase RlpA family protein [Pseudomonas sp.]|jgi:rare lipoprotein A|uniref:septal ring lytic transglycosylase RlpA family protein n=1 Tax=Pseudomonas sp. TaxID=306 RepID=UPI00272BDA1A|nr:septal ring lytic transglycosylase RlpA family protein [Pseudomonas sp.]
MRLSIIAAALLACLPATAQEPSDQPQYSAVGKASFYSSRFHGRPTASGAPYDQTALTAAHPTLPFGTMVCVTNTQNGRSVAVEINDRGPFTGGRIIDLSRRAAQEIGMINSGSARVRVEACEEETI